MRSFWLHESLAGERRLPPLAGKHRTDVAIVGAGMTGLWCALHIKHLEPTIEVVVVERDICGAGASGRNAGYVLDWWAKLGGFEKWCGVDGSLQLARTAERSVAETAAFCAAHAPEAQYRQAGWLWGASNEAQLGAWESVVALHRARGVDVLRVVDRDEAVALGGSPMLLGGVLQANTGTVQPAQLVRGLRDAAIAAGVQIFEGSPVRTLEDGRSPTLRTRDGTLVADVVVLAMNCWLISLPVARKSMFVVGSDMACTEPIPDLLPEQFAAGVGMTDARMLLRYARTSAEGRLFVGLAGSVVVHGARAQSLLTGCMSAKRVTRLEHLYAAAFPKIAAQVPLTRSWTGPVDRSWTGVPFVDWLNRRRSIAITGGYSGNGVGPSHAVARMLASLVLRRDDEFAGLAALLPARGGVPPDPLAYLGGRMVRAAVARKEQLEDQGRRVPPLVRRVAHLAPAAVVPMPGQATSVTR